MCFKFWTFKEKNERRYFNTSQIIYPERCGYLNASRVLFIKTTKQSFWSYLRKPLILFLHTELNWDEKNDFHSKSWLGMTSTFVINRIIYCYQFECSYLKTTYFLQCFYYFFEMYIKFATTWKKKKKKKKKKWSSQL